LPRCTRRRFTERLASWVALWALRTPRLSPWLVHIALALTVTAGARLSCGLGLAVSRTTRLCLLRRLLLPRMAIPQVLGVDDWALQKGQSYETIVIDRERHRSLARLPGREAKIVARW
jgi:hypothetical protein